MFKKEKKILKKIASNARVSTSKVILKQEKHEILKRIYFGFGDSVNSLQWFHLRLNI